MFRLSRLELSEIAEVINAKIRGIAEYYGLFSRSQIGRVLQAVDMRIIKWMQKKYKLGYRITIEKLRMIKQSAPRLFYHWQMGMG